MSCCSGEDEGGDIDYDDFDWDDFDYGEYCDETDGCVCDEDNAGFGEDGNEYWNCYGDDDYSWEY